MIYEAYFRDFVADKRRFFADIKTTEEAELRANDEEHDYGFVAQKQDLIEKEFNHQFAILKQNDANRDAFWLYCYYCCIMLQNYYRAYYGHESEQADKFLKLRMEIKDRCDKKQLSEKSVSEESFLNALGKTISTSLAELLKTPTHASKIKDRISFANLHRIYWFFCRTTLTKSFLLAREFQWIDKLGSALGKKIDIDAIISTLEKPNSFLKVLSVGFFAVRFIINAGMLVTHTLRPSDGEKKLERKQRFYNEFYKYHGSFLNDLVWGTVNLATNYNETFHIAASSAGWMVAGSLFFDFCLIVWLRHLAEQEYFTKKSQYLTEIEYYLKPETYDITQVILLREQEKLLDIGWQAKSSTFWFNATAALLLMAGFSASMVLTSSLMVLGCYVLCTFAVAMYLSDSAYNNYKEKDLLLLHARLLGKNTAKSSQECKMAQAALILTLVKNTLMPTLMIATAALCWQAALVLTALYASNQLWNAYSKHVESRQVEEENGLQYK